MKYDIVERWVGAHHLPSKTMEQRRTRTNLVEGGTTRFGCVPYEQCQSSKQVRRKQRLLLSDRAAT